MAKIVITHMMFDPPSGWRYGFPKPLPDHLNRIPHWDKDDEAGKAKYDADLTLWILEQGYPAKDVEWALSHSRMWDASTVIDDGEG